MHVKRIKTQTKTEIKIWMKCKKINKQTNDKKLINKKQKQKTKNKKNK